jgi:hypothetical protein
MTAGALAARQAMGKQRDQQNYAVLAAPLETDLEAPEHSTASDFRENRDIQNNSMISIVAF